MKAYTMGYKYRIYPNKEQENLINRIIGSCRFVYNHFLAVRRDQWNVNHRSIGLAESQRLLTDLKRCEETSWLKEADSMALQEALKNLDKAYQNFSRSVLDTHVLSQNALVLNRIGRETKTTVFISQATG